MVEIKFTPLRPWSDFFPGAERFAIPDIYDLPKWNNRMTCNLLYYQTNYMLMAVIVFLAVGFMDPISMFTGAAVVAAVFLGAEWAADNKAIIKNFKKENPILFVFFVLLASYLLIPLFGEVMVFLLAIKLPLFLIFTHASLRLRNMRNKLENKLERAGLKKSLMGILLEALGQEEENLNKIQDFLDGKLKE